MVVEVPEPIRRDVHAALKGQQRRDIHDPARASLEHPRAETASEQERRVEVHVHHLRAKLGSAFIRTVRGVGYTLQ